ncbi:MAG: ferrous iron transport protein A [Opitutales bacterium]|nr:ferrous iron transport protein A [Opitutales bacterium]MBQ2721680.1 ferrous iron transport protein A [Opitutales bacterium]
MAKKTENSQKSVSSNKELTLADLPIGSSATIVKIIPNARGGKKFADVGLVPGTELVMESHAPFGGLIRVKVMETSMALHSDDAKNIVMKKESKK